MQENYTANSKAGECGATQAHIFRFTSGAVENLGICTVTIPDLKAMERELLLAGSLINYNKNRVKNNG